MPPFVRQYTRADRTDVRTIAANTAFFGKPVERFLDDRNFFCDAIYSYYTDYETDYNWVAEAEGNVVGFLMGCIDSSKQGKIWMSAILPRLIRRTLTGRYHIGRRTVRYGLALMSSVWDRDVPDVDVNQFPAHLHINLGRQWRGYGLGSRLMNAYLSQLRALSVPGVHLRTTNRNRAACRLYEKLGFQLLDARPTRRWSPWLDRPVENRSYGLIL